MERLRMTSFLWIRHEVFRNPHLTGADILVYASLMEHMNQQTQECFPSLARIREESRLSRNTVFQSLDKLEAERLIYRRRGRGRVNRYILLEPTDIRRRPTNDKEMPRQNKQKPF